MKPGENLQRLVRALEQATNNHAHVKVESPKRLPDKDTGQLREHDVVLTFSLGHHTMLVALECRDRSRKVGVPAVEAFRHKCDRTGVHRGIIVSPLGFTKTALAKAEAWETGCLGLEEADRFNWCLAPGIEYFERDLMQGPSWQYFTATPFDGSQQLYDNEGRAIDPAGFTNMAQAALNQRSPEDAQREDRQSVANPVLCSFDNTGASAFHLIDRNGTRVPLTRMVMHILYRSRYTLVPFQFRTYIDHCKGNQLYTVAIAPIELAGLSGDLVMHHDGEGAHVLFVPRNPAVERSQ
jgi:Restriction endonuclease